MTEASFPDHRALDSSPAVPGRRRTGNGERPRRHLPSQQVLDELAVLGDSLSGLAGELRTVLSGTGPRPQP